MAKTHPKSAIEIIMPEIVEWNIAGSIYKQTALSAYALTAVMSRLTGVVQRVFVNHPEMIERWGKKQLTNLDSGELIGLAMMLLGESPDILEHIFAYGLITEKGEELLRADLDHLKKHFRFRQLPKLIHNLIEQNKEDFVGFWESMKENFPQLAKLQKELALPAKRKPSQS